MLSKNNSDLLSQKMEPRKQRFTIKRLTVGVASVLVSTLFMVQGGDSTAKADVNETTKEGETVEQDSSLTQNEVVLNASTSTNSNTEEVSTLNTNEANTSVTNSEVAQTNEVVQTGDGESTNTNEVANTSTNEQVNSTPVNIEQNETANVEQNVTADTESNTSVATTEQDATTETTSAPIASNSSFRAVPNSNEVQVYSKSSEYIYSKDKTVQVTSVAGYVQKDKHTSTSEVIRWVVKYKPTVVSGKATSAPMGLRITSNNSYTLPSSITVNGQTVNKNADSNPDDALYYSPSVKANIGVENTIEFKIVSKERLKSVGLNFDFATSFLPNDKQIIDPSNQQYANLRNVIVATSKLDEKAYDQYLQEVEAPADKVETSEIPYTTEYQADQTLEAGVKNVAQAGVVGQQTITTTYTIENGKVVEHVGDPVVTKEPVTEIVKVGTKPKVETSKIPFETIYRGDETKDAKTESVSNAGQVGEITKTTTYTLNTQTGDVTANEPTTTETIKKIDRVIVIGTKPTVEETNIPFKIVEQLDDTMSPDDPEVIVTAGKEGKKVVTTTYTVDPTTGKVSETTTEEVTAPVDQVVKRGIGQNQPIAYQVIYRADETKTAGEKTVSVKGQTGLRHPDGTVITPAVDEIVLVGVKPSVTEEVLAYTTRYEDDETMKATDAPIVLVAGKDGKKVTTITYTLDEKTGEVSANDPQVAVTDPVEEVIKRGVGQDQTIAYQVIYRADETKTAGEKTVSVKGQNGLRHPDGTVTTPAVDEIVLVGVKPSVTEEVLAYTTRYEDDETMKATDAPIVLVAGKDGKKVTTITYTLDEKTGEVSANDPQVAVTDPVEEVIKRGVGQDQIIAYQVIYRADETKTAGEKTVSVKGQNGLRHPNGTVTTPAVDEIVLVGVKPSVTEEVLAYTTRYEDDETMKATDAPIVLVAGKDGKKVTTITYTLDEKTGEVSANDPQVAVTDPVEEVIKRGVGQDQMIAYQVIYRADETKTAGEKTVSVKGQNGVRHPNGTVTTPAVDEIVLVGVKPSVTEEVLAYTTRYEDDQTMKITDAPVVLVAGKDGKKMTTITYTLDEKTGEVSATTPQVAVTDPVEEVIKRGIGQDKMIDYQVIYRADITKPLGTKEISVKGQTGILHPNGTVTKAAVDEVVLVGIKPNVVEVAVPYHVVTVEDAKMLKTDPMEVLVVGKDGRAITTTNYVLDEKTGLVSVANVDKELIPAVDQQIKVGVGQEEEIPYETRYVADETLEKGIKLIKVAGQMGIRHPNGTVTKEPVTELIAVGTMPTVVEEPLSFETIYQDDPTMPVGTFCVITSGKEGLKRLVTTYEVDELTGELIETTTEEIVEPVAEVIAKGTKVEEKVVQAEPVAVQPKEAMPQKEQVVTKAPELPQLGDSQDVTAALLGSLGILSALGLAAFGKKRKENN